MCFLVIESFVAIFIPPLYQAMNEGFVDGIKRWEKEQEEKKIKKDR